MGNGRCMAGKGVGLSKRTGLWGSSRPVSGADSTCRSRAAAFPHVMGFAGFGPFQHFQLPGEDGSGDRMRALAVPCFEGGKGSFQDRDDHMGTVVEAQLEQGRPEVLTEIGGIPNDRAGAAEEGFETFFGGLEHLPVHGLVLPFAGDFLTDGVEGDHLRGGRVFRNPLGFSGTRRPPQQDQLRGGVLQLPRPGDPFLDGLNQACFSITDRLVDGVALEFQGASGEGGLNGRTPGIPWIASSPQTEFLTTQAEEFYDFQLGIQVRAKAASEVGHFQPVEQRGRALPGQLTPSRGRSVVLHEAARVVVQGHEREHRSFHFLRQSKGGEAQAKVVPTGLGMARRDDAVSPVDLAGFGGERFSNVVKNGGELEGEFFGRTEVRQLQKPPAHLFQNETGMNGHIALAMPDRVLRGGFQLRQEWKRLLP